MISPLLLVYFLIYQTHAVEDGQENLILELRKHKQSRIEEIVTCGTVNEQEGLEELRDILDSRWAYPSGNKNRMAAWLTVNSGSVEYLRALSFDIRFDPYYLELRRASVGPRNLLLLPQILPDRCTKYQYIRFARAADGLRFLRTIDWSKVAAEYGGLLLVAAASSGRTANVQFLLDKVDPTYGNNMAIRFAGIFGFFDMAVMIGERVGIDEQAMVDYLYRVYEPIYMECWESVKEPSLALRSAKLLKWFFDLGGDEPEFKYSACRRAKMHFSWAIRTQRLTPVGFFRRRIEALERAIPLASMSAQVNYLIQYYLLHSQSLARILKTMVSDPEDRMRESWRQLRTAFSPVSMRLARKEYPVDDAAKAYHRLFFTKYDRLLRSAVTSEQAAAYAEQRSNRHRYYRQRTAARASTNQTPESQRPFLTDQETKSTSVSTADPSVEYWMRKEAEVLRFFGAWFIGFDQDFKRYAEGVSLLSVPLYKLVSKQINMGRKRKAIAAFLLANPHYLPYYAPQDWKRLHGFTGQRETGSKATVTIIDRFANTEVPQSLIPATRDLCVLVDDWKLGDSHGVNIAGLISHPQLGVSKDISLFLVDVSYFKEAITFDGIPSSATVNSVADLQRAIQSASASFISDFTNAIGDVVNVSFAPPSDGAWSPSYDLSGIVSAGRLYTLIRGTNCVLVFSAGNTGSRMAIGNFGPKLLASHEETRPFFVNSVALHGDGLHLANYTEEPGDDEHLQKATLCAVGTGMKTVGLGDREVTVSGTSYSAPVTTAAAALVLSHIRKEFPNLGFPRRLVARALLESATPVLLVPTTEQERQRLGCITELETPVALKSIRALDLKPMPSYSAMLAGEPKRFAITEEMIRESKRRYGMGILNVPAAQWRAHELAVQILADQSQSLSN